MAFRKSYPPLDADTPEPGWDCYGAAGAGVLPGGVPVTWAPGTGAVEFPEGTGVRFAPGDIMVVQMHYNLVDGAGIDASQIKLKWADTVEKEAFQVLIDPFLFSNFSGDPASLPAGQESTTDSWTQTFAEMFEFASVPHMEDIELLSVLPHMHKRGRTMSVNLERTNGENQCAGDVDRWDFNWQTAFFYENPIAASADDSVTVECSWNTMDATDDVMPGFGTANEMCLIGLLYTAR